MKIMFRDGDKHPSPNSGVIEAAFAGSLGVCFGGPSSYGGKESVKPFIGDERRQFDPSIVLSSIRLMYATTFLMAGLTLAVRVAAVFAL